MVTFKVYFHGVLDKCFTLNVAATLVKLAILPPMISTFPEEDRERGDMLYNMFMTEI